MSDITLDILNEKLEKILSLVETEKTKETEFSSCLPTKEVESNSCSKNRNEEVVEEAESENNIESADEE